ncbi:Tetratricopeptide-like helical [Penicillium cataractarum]|uniref:Tetratricopeptide-like helical n=1 Tax=Penicillium cataractarum TaxID=2100454 RepID=A0A9W9UVG1_9EURO|nr:Tetratricopeptide-like helical [Penicillium cataractarum]KAJ5358988.1 Tetratricopeptide-like helical [Penicillium cataractarum]
MARISDLVQDSKLETYFLPDCSVETVHRFQESDPASRQRLVTRSEHWRRQKRIGGGGFGTVWLEKCIKGGRPGATPQDGAVRAVKQIDIDTRLGSIEYNRELEAIAKFSHSRYERCFVKSFGWYEGPSQLFITMEYFENGDLFAYLYQKPPLPEAEAKDITYQILDGLSMMHENGFAHRDLKPHNILIKSHPPEEWWIKLADFGITKRIEESYGQSTTLKGTPRYLAPEIWGFVERGSAYATDIWALGEILFEIITKKPAFGTPASLASYKTQQHFPVTMLTNADISQAGVDFVLSLMRPYPSHRITATSAMSHVWIQSLLPYSYESMTAIQDEPRIPSPVAILTNEFASWTTKNSSEAPKATYREIPRSTTTSDLVNATQGNTSMAQERKSYSSLGTTIPHFMQGQVGALELSPTELGSENQTGRSLYRQKRYKEAETMFQQPFQGREVLGHGHEDILSSAYRNGRSLYDQERYEEAEILFRDVFQGQEKTLGYDHEATLKSAYWLGCSLYGQKRYQEAETMFRQASRGREKVLGHNHEDTLNSVYLHGCSLLSQNRYKEAETMFRQAFQGRVKVLGPDHEATLHSAHWHGYSLYRQKRYKEAEAMFRQAFQGREKVLGHNHADTLNSSYLLGRSLYEQERYEEAGIMFREVFQGQEKVLGYDHEGTLHSAHWLGCSLYGQDRYKEAETMFRRAFQGRERVLGHDHEDTLNSEYLLGRSLYDQDRYEQAANMFQQAYEGRQRVLGYGHRDTLLADSYLLRARQQAREQARRQTSAIRKLGRLFK